MLNVDQFRREIEALESTLKERSAEDREFRRQLATARRLLSLQQGAHFVVLTCATQHEDDLAEDDSRQEAQVQTEVYGVCHDEPTKAHGLQLTLNGVGLVDVKSWSMGGDTLILSVDSKYGTIRFSIHESNSGWSTLYMLSVHTTLEDAAAQADRMRALCDLV